MLLNNFTRCSGYILFIPESGKDLVACYKGLVLYSMLCHQEKPLLQILLQIRRGPCNCKTLVNVTTAGTRGYEIVQTSSEVTLLHVRALIIMLESPLHGGGDVQPRVTLQGFDMDLHGPPLTGSHLTICGYL